MTRCLSQFAFVAVFALTTSVVVCAEEMPDRIRGYFPGNWESAGGRNGNGSVQWKLVAGGKAMAGPGLTDNSGATFGMGGWKSKEKVWLHTFFEADGGYGTTELTKFENGTYSGKTRMVSGDGEVTTGDFDILIKDDNHFTLKIKSGDQAVTSEWTRVK